ncbi:uncharacterized protein L201_002119 [Kwoniella dendrophila CBS 6074]|uniref:[histone H3]-trimethyl-L-lysine(4) demethylase n=1 Tax=Kwoniella dendrophila CBS 6074 TaxID=1295534 RepID=A0AAX4JQA6_9TREE
MSQGGNTSMPPSATYPTRTRMGSMTKPRTPRASASKAQTNGNDPSSSSARPSIHPSPSNESSRRKATFTTSLNYPEVLPAPTYFANEGELQRSQRRSKVEALTKLDRAGTPIQISAGPTATSFLPSSAQNNMLSQQSLNSQLPIAGPSASRNPLHRPVVVNPLFNPQSVRQEAPRNPAPRTTPRLFGIEECPTYYPTIEEFKDCMGYIASISDEARSYGICKIVPPEGWKMPCTLDTETFRFRTRLQRLNQLEAASRAKVNFLDQLSMFHNQSSDTQVTIPKIDRQPLDLWKLRKEVNKLGGHLELDRTKTWPKLTESLGYKVNWSNQVREAYIRIILPFDNYSVRAKSASVSPLTPLHNSAVNDNGNVKPPAFHADTPPSPSQPRPIGRMGTVKNSPRTRFSSRMSGAGINIPPENSTIPLSSAPLSLTNGLEAAAEIERPLSATPSLSTLKIKVPGFSTRDGSESELSDADSSSDGSPNKGKVSTPEYKKGDVCEICRFGHAAEKILLCDGCDRGFHTYCLDPPLASVPTNEEWFCTSCLLSQGDDFGFEEGEDHSVASFQARDSSFSWHWWNRHRPVPSSSSSPPRSNSNVTQQTNIQPSNPLARNFGKITVTEDDVEREFWRLTESQSDTVEIEYGADVHSTTHGSAGPTMETHPLDPYAVDGWNLNNMPILPDSLLRYIRSDISGMTVPWIYLGMMFSTFCWHNEDHYTYSVNYMYWGETKTWYGVPGSDAEKFEEAMKSEAPELFEQQPGLLFQLVTMMNPGRMRDAGVKVVACDQRPNEFVITFPKAYHCGFNHGINLNEAVNFALPDWLPEGRESVMRYQQYLKPPVFSHHELLITITLYSETIKTALWLRDNLTVMVDNETRRRDSLRLAYPGILETQTEEDGPEEQYQCAVCKSFCYLAQVTCTCTKLVACLDHADQLCSCAKTKKTLRKRYTEAQLDDILAVVVARASQPDAWRTRLYALLETPRPALKSMRALVADGEKIAYPMPEVVSLRALVDRANSWVERVSVLVTRKTVGRRRKGKKDDAEDEDMNVDRSPETLSGLLQEAEKLAFDAPEILQLRQSLLNIQGFQSEATLILSTPEDELDLEKCKTALILGESLNLDLPEITTIANIVNRLTWFKKVEEEVDDRTLEYGDTVKLLDQAEEYGIPADHPSISELKKRRETGATWLASVERLYKAPQITIEEISDLIEGKELIPVSIDKMRQLEGFRKQALNWQASAKNFLSSNGSVLAASRLCKNVSTAAAPLNKVVIPEVAELQAELEYHTEWQDRICDLLEIEVNNIGNTMNYIKREFESHLLPEDDEPNDEYVCFCRGTGDKIMVKCQNCLGEYHPKCVGISPKYASLPYQCEMCQRLLPGLSPSFNDFGVLIHEKKWNFKIVPTEFKVAKEIIELALRYSETIMGLLDPQNTAEPCRDINKLRHSIRKIYTLPLLLDATNIKTSQKVIFISWLFRRLQDAIKFHSGISNNPESTTTMKEKEKPKTRGRKPKLILAQSHPKEFHCICGDNSDQGQINTPVVECTKCNQKYHTLCVKAPMDLSVHHYNNQNEGDNHGNPKNKPFWRCPCCAVKEAKFYIKGVEARVQLKEQFGTNQYIDYRATINEYAEQPIMVNLHPSTDVIILECTEFIPPVIPEDFGRDSLAGGEGDLVNGEGSRKRRKTRPSDIGIPATLPDLNGNGNSHSTSIPAHSPMNANGNQNGYISSPISSSAPHYSQNYPQQTINGGYRGPQTAYPSPITHHVPQPQTARMSPPNVYPQNGNPSSEYGYGTASRLPPSTATATAAIARSTTSPPGQQHDNRAIAEPRRQSPIEKATSPSNKSVSPRQPPPHILPLSNGSTATHEPAVASGLHVPTPLAPVEDTTIPPVIQNIAQASTSVSGGSPSALKGNITSGRIQSPPAIPIDSVTGQAAASSGQSVRIGALEQDVATEIQQQSCQPASSSTSPKPAAVASIKAEMEGKAPTPSGNSSPPKRKLESYAHAIDLTENDITVKDQDRQRSRSRSTQGSSIHDAIVVNVD